MLDADPAQAALRYESLRQKLIKFFECRGAACAPDLADVTIDRVARKVEQDEPIAAINRYFYAVARLVALEHFSRQVPRETPLDERVPSFIAGPGKSHLAECLGHCLAALPGEQRNLILDYYSDERQKKIDSRKRLAADLGIELNHLRIKVHRIRAGLEACVRKCMEKKA